LREDCGGSDSQRFLEEIWVRDVADLSWEVFRLRQVKAKLWTSHVAAAIQCTSVCGQAQAKKLSRQWETGAIGRIDQLATGRTVESITADVFLVNGDYLERIDRMIIKAEACRNAALREIECCRSSIAQALRRTSDDVVDAAFADVAPDRITNKASFGSSVIIASGLCGRWGIGRLHSRLQLFRYYRELDPPPVFFRNGHYKPALGPRCERSVPRKCTAIDLAPQRVEHVIEFDAALKHHLNGAEVLDCLAGHHIVVCR
jgi:hypothetical protein